MDIKIPANIYTKNFIEMMLAFAFYIRDKWTSLV